MVKQRLIRDDPPLDGDVEILRAHLLDDDLLRRNAELSFEFYGFYGLSVFHPTGAWAKDRILAEKLNNAAHLTVFTVAALAATGLEVLPTGAEPHGDIVILGTTGRNDDDPGDLDTLVSDVQSTEHRVEENPHHRHEENPA